MRQGVVVENPEARTQMPPDVAISGDVGEGITMDCFQRRSYCEKQNQGWDAHSLFCRAVNHFTGLPLVLGVAMVVTVPSAL